MQISHSRQSFSMPYYQYSPRLCVAKKSQLCPASPIFPRHNTVRLFLFGDLKRELRGFRFQISEELLVEIRKLAAEISPENLLDVFHDWISWCESLTAGDGMLLFHTLWLTLWPARNDLRRSHRSPVHAAVCLCARSSNPKDANVSQYHATHVVHSPIECEEGVVLLHEVGDDGL
jgi:hypothetical protein